MNVGVLSTVDNADADADVPACTAVVDTCNGAACVFVFCFIDMSEDHSIGLRVPAINSTIGFIFSLGFLGYKFSKEIDKNFIYFLYSVLLMIPSGVFISYKINIHPWFDKNDFGHLILVLTMIFFYRAIKSYSDIILKEN